MPSGRPSEGVKRRSKTRVILVIILLAAVVPYLLLLTGGLSWAVRLAVGAFADDGNISVGVHGFASGIFFGTRADSVVVSDSLGLKVIVSGITVRGSLVSYLLGTGLQNVWADSLGIQVPRPASGPPSEPDPDMKPLFQNVITGFVTDVDTLGIRSGRIVDNDGTVLVDSMSICARVFSDTPAELEVYSGGVFIPLFGAITGSGSLTIDTSIVTLRDFTAVSPAGTMIIQGTLQSDSSLSLSGEGNFTTSFIPDAPLAEGRMTAVISGTTTNPEGSVTISEGNVRFMERDIGFTADSISGSMDDASAGVVNFSTPGISGSLAGRMAFSGPVWNGECEVEFDLFDPSDWSRDSPPGSLTGTMSASVSGSGEVLSSGIIDLDLQGQELAGVAFEWLHLHAEADPASVFGTLSASVLGAEIGSEWVVALGEGFEPVSWSGSAVARVDNAREILGLIEPASPLTGLTGFVARLDGQGTLERFRFACDVRAEGAELDTIEASGLFLIGDAVVDISGSRGVTVGFDGESGLAGLSAGDSHLSGVVLDGAFSLGLPSGGLPNIGFAGTASVDTAAIGGLLALDCEVLADVSLADDLPSGSLRISSDRVETSGGNLSVGIHAESRNGMIRVDSLEILHEGGARVVAGLSVDMAGDTVSVALDSIRVTMNKLRLVRAGGAELVISPDGAMGIDSIWIDPPAGYLRGSGRVGSDGEISASFATRSVDLASLGLVLGLDLPISGVFSSDIQAEGRPGDLEVLLHACVDDPTYGPWTQGDSITVDASLIGGLLTVDGIWIWSDGIRSGVSLSMDSVWNGTAIDLSPERLVALEAELTGVGDWLLYILPFPIMTSGASISSRIEYSRDDPYLSAGLAGHFQRFYIAGAGLEFPMSSLYISYPDPRAGDDYNASFRITSGQGNHPALSAELRARLSENIPLRTGEPPVELEEYSFRAELNGWETILNGMGWVSLSGSLSTSSSDMSQRPIIRGKIRLDEGVIALQSEQGTAGSGGEAQAAELPMDLYIDVLAERGLWLRNSYMNIELAADITILTQEGRPVFTGNISVVRGTVSVLNKDFRITSGTVEIIQGTPPSFMLNITAEARVRSSMSREVYTIEVNVTGDPEKPEIALSGSGDAGDLTNEDIVTLLTLGMTYGEMQQMDSGALETELESVTQGVLGNMLARSVREGMGLDALSISPDLLSDTTGLTVEVGKYVLPNLYVSYTDDVFSAKPGTMSAQYYFNRDIYLQGSTKTTLSGNQEPTFELHYTIRY